MEDPIKEDDPYYYSYWNNLSNCQKNQNRSFRFTSTTKERIKVSYSYLNILKESENKYQYCDPTPTLMHNGSSPEKIMNLRPIDHSKDVGGPCIRMKPRNNLERVYDSLLQKNISNIP